MWNKNLPCSNCSSFRAFTQHNQISKLEFNDGKAYQVLSKYIEVDGTPCVLELVSKLKENPLLTVDGRNLLSDNMSAYSQAPLPRPPDQRLQPPLLYRAERGFRQCRGRSDDRRGQF